MRSLQTEISGLNGLRLDMEDVQQMSLVARALSVPQRVEMLRLLGENNIMSISELAQRLELPVSSTSMHMSILEEAGLVQCERLSTIRGSMKMCTRRYDDVTFMLRSAPKRSMKCVSQSMPIGAYSQAEEILDPCGLASELGPIGKYNVPLSFYRPERLDAQVLWFKSGVLEYQFSMLTGGEFQPEMLELSFEACTQAQMEDTQRLSEIQVSINGVLLGSALCTCDSQGRRGVFNASWWPDVATQHGELIKWQITPEGCFLHGEKVSDVTLKDLSLEASPCIRVRLAVPRKDDQAGVNLFGSNFGDYSQAIDLKMGYYA